MIYQVRIGRSTDGRVSWRLALIAVLASGCAGGTTPPEKGLVPVKGKVTLNGGPWPRAGAVFFTPKDSPAGSTSRMGVGSFDTNGVFDSVDGGYGDAKGLHPGFYWVSVKCKEGDEEMPIPGQPVKEKDYVPKKYQDPSTSGLTLKVEEGKPADAVFDVEAKK